MLARYAKGRRLEYAVKRKLEAEGYTVFRCAASKPCDLIAVKQGSLLLIECKSGDNPYASPHVLEQLTDLSKNIGARAVLAVRKNHRTLQLYEIVEGRSFPFSF